MKNSKNWKSQMIKRLERQAKEARDAGDRVLEQSYLQHAEHFIRITKKEN